jgi:large subunit ribosomal protein L9
MARSTELLLLNTVENLGIVGDLVKVKPGFARNFLLPHGLAEFPTPEKIEALKEARQKALAEVQKARAGREELLARMNSVEISLIRSCNDQGALYGSISQRDIADALQAAGYGVDPRAVRLSQTIRRVGTYHVPIQLDRDLRGEIHLIVQPDRKLEQEMRESEAKAKAEPGAEGGEGAEAPPASAAAKDAKPKREKPAKSA